MGNGKTLLKGGNVLTMQRKSIAYSNDILISDGKIEALGRDLPVDGGCNVIDCRGKYMIPGLIDAHTHPDSADMLPMFIASGVTSVRNLKGDRAHLELDCEIRRGERIGPYIYSSGAIYDGIASKETGSPAHVYISTEDEAEEAVYKTIEDGFLWVKTYPDLTAAQTKRMLDTANKCGIKVCGHMSHIIDDKLLCDWGYSSVEHTSSLPPHKADVEYLAKNGMWFCPTQVVCETLPDYVWNGKKLEDVEHYELLPEKMKRFWAKCNDEVIADYKGRGVKPDINVIIARGRTFMEHSERIMAGADAPYPAIMAGFSLYDELDRLVNVFGMTPYEALKAATVNPAEWMEIDAHKGALAPLMDADIVILDANPLADIHNTKRISSVIQGGKVYDRQALDALLDSTAAMTDEEDEFFVPMF